MWSEIIILTKSYKNGGYCVAGLDTFTMKLVRIISEDTDTDNSISISQMTYISGEEIQIYDLVLINIVNFSPNTHFHQPENILCDSKSIWAFVRKSSLAEVTHMILPQNYNNIFYNSDRKVSQELIDGLPISEYYSLMLIPAEDACLEVFFNQFKEKLDVKLNLKYNGIIYNGISVTGREIKDKAIQMFNSNQNSIINISKSRFLFLSIAGCPYEGYYYKFLASILR
ncbi:MAG: hypothetical protein WCN92_09455 [Eubacteriales bacterium]